jgi:hypothetical protein
MSVDPGELNIDLLPISTLPTKADWEKQGKRLIMIETRSVVIPGMGMQLSAVSHRIEIKQPLGCQFVDSTPSSEMELVGQREVIVSETGKFSYSVSSDATLSSSLSGGPAKIESSLVEKDTETFEHQTSGSEKLSHSPHVPKVISSAVESVARWELLRTPTQTLLGSNNFTATVLVPADANEIELVIHHSADIEGWGSTSISKTLKASVPTGKG